KLRPLKTRLCGAVSRKGLQLNLPTTDKSRRVIRSPRRRVRAGSMAHLADRLIAVLRALKTNNSRLDLRSELLIAKSALVSDRAEMLVDAKYNEHKFGGDARHNNAHADAKHTGDEKDQADKWIRGHRRQRADHARESEQDGNHNGQPI